MGLIRSACENRWWVASALKATFQVEQRERGVSCRWFELSSTSAVTVALCDIRAATTKYMLNVVRLKLPSGLTSRGTIPRYVLFVQQ